MNGLLIELKTKFNKVSYLILTTLSFVLKKRKNKE